ncbi:MAG: ABC transporter ATP-binding protein [Novosphingobium sp.]
MTAALVVERVGKRFQHRDSAGPRTFHQFIEGGWRKRHARRDFWALRNVSFQVEAGEMLGVIGSNGSGKSTLLRMLGGVMRPDEGRIERSASVSGLLDLNAGMHPDLTGRENAIGGGIIAGLSRRQIVARMDEVIAFAELEDFIDEPLRSYSAGMRLRLGFAVAAQTSPKILLIDEVLAVGDMGFQRKCLDRINQFRAEGCAIVLISHDLAQVEATCDRAMWLRNGEVVTIGATQSVARHYESRMLQNTVARTPLEVLDSGQSHLQLNVNRFGSLENQITRVRFLDQHGVETQSFKSGDAVTVQVWVETTIPLRDLHLSVTLANDRGVDLIDMTTEENGLELPGTVGKSIIRLDLDGVPLAHGLYHFSVGIYEKSWSLAYDRHVNAYDIQIDGEESWCSLNPPHRWKISSPAPA